MPQNAVSKIVSLAGVLAWDASCTFLNLITPSKKEGSVTPQGHPGADGKWPEYVPPKEGDSRCSCPALNAMANHGILPRDGKNITFEELNRVCRTTYNFAPTFCYFVPNYAANMLGRNYKTDSFDLSDLDLHNGIEHDASLTRTSTSQHLGLEPSIGKMQRFLPDQSKPYVPFIKELLAEATGKDANGKALLTIEDLSRYSSKRRADARASNPEFTLEKIHKTFGSSNSSTLLTIFGGRVEDLEHILLEERIPEGWEFGLTIITFNTSAVSKVEKGTDEEKYLADKKAAGEVGTVGEGSSIAK
ncbi:Chloroperoxidase [Ephemerocybe angulata]|uniref:Chloroperoxidase n=1 Tax=Ephemerocybe angulata TaxID=980116 RepID=A0A8H6HFA9_9AGAR|nr:Chloroperoxidase [Tulosesus angulatus]